MAKYKAVFGFTFLLWFLVNLYWFKFQMPKITVISDPEIGKILAHTPYLWRNMSWSEPWASKVAAQRQWIKNIYKTDFVLKHPGKRIAILDNVTIERSSGVVTCPYAKGFERKCTLVDMRNSYMFLRGLVDTVDAEVVVRDDAFRDLSLIPYLPKWSKDILQVILVMEPPYLAKNAVMGKYDAALATYLRTSDIPISYGIWREASDFDNLGEKLPEYTPPDYLKSKRKLAVAMISNCESRLRLAFIDALKNHIEVDVYGRCGSFSCPREDKAKCLSHMGSKYKFYLAFENSNCVDYLTEKYFQNALLSGMVPVVMGAPKESYDAIGPPGSYIHASDFESPEKLAKHLLYLNENDEEYLKYFEWKKTKGYITSDLLTDFLCRVCGMLYYRDFVKNPSWDSPTISIQDIDKCLPYDVWRWQ